MIPGAAHQLFQDKEEMTQEAAGGRKSDRQRIRLSVSKQLIMTIN